MTRLIPIQSHEGRYLDPHQARLRTPTTFEDLLADAIERAFGAGKWELEELLEALNRTGPLAPGGLPWTAERFQVWMKQAADPAAGVVAYTV